MNNYDISSTGVNLELSVSWDNDLSRMYFDESFHVLQYSGYRQHSILVFNWFGNTDQSDFDFSDIENYTFTKSDLIEWLKEAFYTSELNDLSTCYFNKPFSKLSKNELLELIESEIYDYQDEFKLRFTPTYQTIVSRGYCQGDYSEIIFTKSLLDKMREGLTSCKDKTDQEIAEYFQDDIDHLLWDSPLYARLTIDDEEYYLDDFQNDHYSYDKEETIEHVKNTLKHEKLDIIIKFLTDNLPDQPDYI